MFCLAALVLIAGLIAGCGSGSGGSSAGGGNSSPTTVSITITGATAVATKIGSGTFSAATPDSNGKLDFSIPSGTSNFAVAYVCFGYVYGAHTQIIQFVVEASTADTTALIEDCPNHPDLSIAPPPPPPTLTGSVDFSAFPAASPAYVVAQNGDGDWSTSRPIPANNGSFSDSAPVGSDRVEVEVIDSHSEGPVAVRNFDNQTVPGSLNGGNTVVLGPADATTLETITFNGVPSGYTVCGNDFRSTNSTGCQNNDISYVDYMMGGIYGFRVTGPGATQYW